MADSEYTFVELDETTRRLMLDELDFDIEAHGHPYDGKLLTARGSDDYPGLIRRAITHHDEAWLTARIDEHDRVAGTPAGAARRLAQTEFNRYYIRGICRRAAEHGCTTVIAYRARDSHDQRSDSLLLDGEPQSAARILANLRGKAIAGDPESGLGRVNSGLSARCGCPACAGVGR